MLNPNLIELIQTENESEIEVTFDWGKKEKYRYTKAMLRGTLQGHDFYPPLKQLNLNYKTEKY